MNKDSVIKQILEDLPTRDCRFEMTDEEWYGWFEEAFDAGEKKVKDLSSMEELNKKRLTDKSGNEIIAGCTIAYQVNTVYRAECNLEYRDGILWFVDWTDKNEDISALDFWNEETDSKITKILKYPNAL